MEVDRSRAESKIADNLLPESGRARRARWTPAVVPEPCERVPTITATPSVVQPDFSSAAGRTGRRRGRPTEPAAGAVVGVHVDGPTGSNRYIGCTGGESDRGRSVDGGIRSQKQFIRRRFFADETTKSVRVMIATDARTNTRCRTSRDYCYTGRGTDRMTGLEGKRGRRRPVSRDLHRPTTTTENVFTVCTLFSIIVLSGGGSDGGGVAVRTRNRGRVLRGLPSPNCGRAFTSRRRRLVEFA